MIEELLYVLAPSTTLQVSNVIFKLSKERDEKFNLIHRKLKFVIKMRIEGMILISGMTAPHALGVLELTL